MARKQLAAVMALALLTGVCCRPRLHRRQAVDTDEQTSAAPAADEGPATSASELSNEVLPPVPYNDDDDDDGFEPMTGSATTGGSNIFSLLRIAGAILPSSSNSQALLRNMIQLLLRLNFPLLIRRQRRSIGVEIDTNFTTFTPLLRQEEGSNESDSSSGDSEESGEGSAETRDSPEEDSGTNDASVGDDSDYDEPPGGGDGQGGGVLGLLAGLSGGEDGQSDLGSLLATVSGIVANLSGDGIDLNALIASGLGLFVGLLSEGEENPGAVVASYLLTSLDTVSGGGAKNNGEFFGTFLSRLVKGTSAIQDPADAPSPLWTLKLDVLRAVVQFATSILGLASSSVFSYSG